MDRLASGITNSFRSKFISEVEQKRDRLYLKDEALAMDIAAHCNLCGELKLPLYFQDNILKTKVDLGLDYFTDRMLEECNRALDNHVFTVINIEETEADRVKFTYKMAHSPSASFCTS